MHFSFIYLCNRTQAPLKLELVDTLVSGFSHLVTFVNLPLPPSTANSHTVHHVALLGFVAQATGLVGSRRATGPVHSLQLSELPATDAQQEAKQVRLLLAPQLFKVFVCTHFL